jgi:hypothetical protein
MLLLYEHGSSLPGLAAADRPVTTQLYVARRGCGLSNDYSFVNGIRKLIQFRHGGF